MIDQMAYKAALAIVLVAGRVLPLHPKRPKHRPRTKPAGDVAGWTIGPLGTDLAGGLPTLGEWDGYTDWDDRERVDAVVALVFVLVPAIISGTDLGPIRGSCLFI